MNTTTEINQTERAAMERAYWGMRTRMANAAEESRQNVLTAARAAGRRMSPELLDEAGAAAHRTVQIKAAQWNAELDGSPAWILNEYGL